MEGRQAREVQCNRADVGGSGARRRGGADEPRRVGASRGDAGARARPRARRRRRGLGRVLPVPGRARRRGEGGCHGRDPPGWLDPGRRDRGGRGRARHGHGHDRDPPLQALTAPGWVFTERDVVRLLALNPRRTDQLRRLGLLHPAGSADQYSFRDLVALRVARTLLDEGATVRQIRRALETLRRLGPASDSPLAELRVTVRDGDIFIERDARLHEPSGQIVMEFSEKGLAEEARVSALRGLVRPLAPPGGSEVERWFELASELDGDPDQWTQAVEAYQRVTTLAPDHGPAWNNLGLLQHRMGHHEDA